MENVFIDTSAFYSFQAYNDKDHETAYRIWRELDSRLAVTTNCIVQETATLIRARIGIKESIEYVNDMLEKKAVEMVYISSQDEKEAWRIFREYDDKSYSFVDCSSLAYMKREKINKVFTFDKHFKQMGFIILE